MRRAFFPVAVLAVAGIAPLGKAPSLLRPRIWQAVANSSTAAARESGATQPQNSPGVATTPRAQAEPTPQPPTPTTVVVLDPAHGGSDSGARGASGVVESSIVLDFARAIRTKLQAQGLRVLLTREGNQDPSFDDRSAMVNGLSGAVFISLHVSSTGPIGTARTYWYPFPAGAEPAPTAGSAAASKGVPQEATSQAPASNSGLVEWEHAQQSYVEWSRRLAELLQIQLAQRFRGSAETPQAAPVRQLRSIAAPAIAIEVSSVSVPDAQQLERMSGSLADAVSRAVSDFRRMLSGNAPPSGGGR